MHPLARIMGHTSHVDVTHTAIKTQLSLEIQKRSVNPALSSNHAPQLELFSERNWNNLSAMAVTAESSSFPARNTRRKSSYRRSKSLLVTAMNTALSTFSCTDAPFSSLTLLSLATHVCETYLDQSHLTWVSLHFPSKILTNLAATRRADNVNINATNSPRPASTSQRSGSTSNRCLENHQNPPSS